MKKTLVSLAVAAAAVTSAHTFAYEPGDFIVRAGAVTVAPDADSDPIAIPALGVPPVNGTSVDVDNNTQLGLTLTYMLSSSLGVEVLAATPFTHNITADLSPLGLSRSAQVGETTHLPPTVSAMWYPMGSADTFKPYLGAGLNYTTFFDTEVAGSLENLVGDLAGAGGPVNMDLDLDDSFGLAFTAGFDYDLSDKWHFNASVRWIDINTEATISNKNLGNVITVNDVQIDPWVYQVNVGYTF